MTSQEYDAAFQRFMYRLILNRMIADPRDIKVLYTAEELRRAFGAGAYAVESTQKVIAIRPPSVIESIVRDLCPGRHQ
jgi:hypothetical protein